MSLKYFHLVFICASWLLLFGTAAWAFWGPEANSSPFYFPFGIASLLLGLSLFFYTPYAWWKLKNIPVGN